MKSAPAPTPPATSAIVRTAKPCDWHDYGGPGRYASVVKIITRSSRRTFSASPVEDAVLTRHRERSRNTRAADWLVASSRMVIAYNHPASNELTALIVTVWRQSKHPWG